MNDKELSILLLESMNHFHNLVKTVNNERYKKEGSITERQFFALLNVKKCEKIELKNLSNNLHVSTSSLCILLNKLVEQGYVYREEDCRDRRNTFYGITDSGKEVLDKEIENFIYIISKKLNHLNKNGKDELCYSLKDLTRKIEKMI